MATLSAPPELKQALVQKIRDKSAKVGVVGLGYVGLPLAVEKAKVGFHVLGVEQNPARCECVNSGENYIKDVVDSELKEAVSAGLITARPDFDDVPQMDVIVIAVPTPLTKNLTPDLQYVESVASQVAARMRPGQLVSLESTTYPGTCEQILLPILERSGLSVERDFWLAHSPERVDPGNKRFTTKNTHKVVGGHGPESLEVATAFYEQTIQNVVPVSSAKAAELTKVFENTFRAVNIALVNELTMLCERLDLDVWEVLDAAFTKPFGIMPFYPGPGVGGHCIPLDPHYLEWKAKEVNFSTHFIALAGEINRAMPEFTRDKAYRILNELGIAPSRSKVLALGATYKQDIDDARESPAIEVMQLMRADGAEVRFYDPLVKDVSRDGGEGLQWTELNDDSLRWADLVCILTSHSDVDYERVVNQASRVFDTRNATRGIDDPDGKIRRL